MATEVVHVATRSAAILVAGAEVASEQVWMAGCRVFDPQGFERVDPEPPACALMVKRFASHPLPSLAGKAGVKSRVVELESRGDLLRLSPSPYGVFALVLDGKLLSYHHQLEKDLLPLLGGAR